MEVFFQKTCYYVIFTWCFLFPILKQKFHRISCYLRIVTYDLLVFYSRKIQACIVLWLSLSTCPYINFLVSDFQCKQLLSFFEDYRSATFQTFLLPASLCSFQVHLYLFAFDFSWWVCFIRHFNFNLTFTSLLLLFFQHF